MTMHPPHPPHMPHDDSPAAERDPVCGMAVTPDSPHRVEHGGRTWHFCSARCAAESGLRRSIPLPPLPISLNG